MTQNGASRQTNQTSTAGPVGKSESRPLSASAESGSNTNGSDAAAQPKVIKAAAQDKRETNRRPRPAAVRESDVANGLLNLEREARKAESEAELGYLMVNGSRVAVQYRQALLLMRSGPRKHRTIAVSSLSAVDRNSTFIRWIERLVTQKLAGENMSKVVSFDVRQEADEDDLDASTYPFGQIALLPLELRDGTVFAHMMFTRESAWDERSLIAAARLCETFSHAWAALAGPARAKRRLRSKSLLWMGAVAGIIAAGFYPLPLSVLAPAEVAPSNPFVVAAPIDGAIEKIVVDPNTNVEKGDLLFTYTDTELRNRVKLAGQAVSVAEARYQQSLRSSFSDPSAKRELSIAQSELQLKASEYDYAQELLNKTRVSASASGLVIFADKDTWTGRPVSTGERIMRIADPSKVEVLINLPVSDAINLQPGAAVELYLDSNPLEPVKAETTGASFHAQLDGEGVLSYRVRASFKIAGDTKLPRIGLRGTAKVYGEQVRLGYYLMRKPLSAVRQWTGY